MSLITIKCPECNKKIDVDTSWVNQDVVCRNCGKTFLLTQYSIPNLDDEYRKDARQFVTIIVVLAIAILCVSILLTSCRKLMSFYDQWQRRESAKVQIEKDKKRLTNTYGIANIEDLQKYIQTSNDKPQTIIHKAFSCYFSLVSDGSYDKLEEMLGKRFDMDLESPKTAFSDLKEEIVEKVKVEFPVSPEDYKQEMEKVAEKKYPRPQIGTVIELSSHRNGTIKGIFGGYTSDKLSFYVDEKKYDMVELSQSSAIMMDRKLNRAERKRFIDEKCKDYQKKKAERFRSITTDLLQQKGYILINNRFYSPSGYFQKLKHQRISNPDSSPVQDPPRRKYKKRRSRISTYRNHEIENNLENNATSDISTAESAAYVSNRTNQQRFLSSDFSLNSPTNASGSKNLSIPSRSSRFTEHIRYYHRGDWEDVDRYGFYYRKRHTKYVRKTF